MKCPNTCWEAGKVAREKLKKKIATYQEGVTLRKKEVEQAKQAFSKDEADLLKLKNEEKILKGLVQQLKGMTFSGTSANLQNLFIYVIGPCSYYYKPINCACLTAEVLLIFSLLLSKNVGT